jgi:betaine-aldehyde dehydrogenase
MSREPTTTSDRAALERPAPGAYGRETHFSGGEWVPSTGHAWHPVHDCGTTDELGRIRSAGAADVDNAVRAAQAAQAAWAACPPAGRARALLDLHERLAERGDELTAVIAAEVGTAVAIADAIQVASALRALRQMAEDLMNETFEEEIGNTTVVHEPVGVVAAITPWNYPLFQAMNKVAAALAAGCTVVHKPSELAPLSAFILAEAVAAADLPAGVYNLLPGDGPTVGAMLAGHPAVQMTSFTGSTATGRHIYTLGAATIKRVALELGGKSASIVLDDADLDVAVRSSVNRAFLNSGQTCDAWTRLLVPRHRLDDVLDVAVAAAGRLSVGDQFDPATRLGPLVSARQKRRVLGYVDGALRDGATAVIGGTETPSGLDRGHFVRPTILTGVRPEMAVAQEEVFGPVLAVLTYDDEDEAIRIANGTAYGLSGAVWSGDADRAMRVARRLVVGQVVVNGGRFNPLAPFGGVKQSGIGREMGRYGLREFLEPKALQH